MSVIEHHTIINIVFCIHVAIKLIDAVHIHWQCLRVLPVSCIVCAIVCRPRRCSYCILCIRFSVRCSLLCCLRW